MRKIASGTDCLAHLQLKRKKPDPEATNGDVIIKNSKRINS